MFIERPVETLNKVSNEIPNEIFNEIPNEISNNEVFNNKVPNNNELIEASNITLHISVIVGFKCYEVN